jgi:flagellar hook-associated protein 3 FlgL
MNTRVPDSHGSSNLTARINTHRARLAVLQERLATGKRINRPSDDPTGTEMVLNLRTSQKQLEQFESNARAVSLRLTAADDVLSGYQTTLDRVRTLIARGLSEVATPQAKEAVAVELESLRTTIISMANTISGDEYVFGGTRQGVPPVDATAGTFAGTSTSPRYVQIEPGAPAIPTGEVAESIFGDTTSTIFQDLSNTVAALRGTGDTAADRATLLGAASRMTVYGSLAGTAQARIGARMSAAEIVRENLTTNILSFDARATEIEEADFAETAVGMADAQRALDANLQVAAQGRRTLFDFLG